MVGLNAYGFAVFADLADVRFSRPRLTGPGRLHEYEIVPQSRRRHLVRYLWSG